MHQCQFGVIVRVQQGDQTAWLFTAPDGKRTTSDGFL
jgi:hypothetical protein